MAVFVTTSKYVVTTSRILSHIRLIWTSTYRLNNNITKDKSTVVTSTEESSEEKDKHQHQHQHDKDEQKYDEDIKTTILNASLPFVNELGWNRNAIIAGAKDVNYPGTVHGLFPSAGSELVKFFYTKCNTELANYLKEKYENISPRSGSKVAQEAIETRLRMVIPYKKRWPQALAIMAMPQNVPSSLANLLTLADDICYYAGDRSVDLTWYSRRIGISAIYKMTELYMLQDDSDDHKETWQFLEQRISEASTVNKVLTQTDSISLQAKETMTSAIIMARNMLGLDWRR